MTTTLETRVKAQGYMPGGFYSTHHLEGSSVNPTCGIGTGGMDSKLEDLQDSEE
jgi:hypothetical protein